MNTMMKLINFLRASSSLQHRLLREFLEDVEANASDLLLHSNVRWLSKGNSLGRFWEQLLTASQESEFSFFLKDEYEMDIVAFLVAITSHLTELNLKLQGQNNSVADLMTSIRPFQRKLDIFREDLEGGSSRNKFKYKYKGGPRRGAEEVGEPGMEEMEGAGRLRLADEVRSPWQRQPRVTSRDQPFLEIQQGGFEMLERQQTLNNRLHRLEDLQNCLASIDSSLIRLVDVAERLIAPGTGPGDRSLDPRLVRVLPVRGGEEEGDRPKISHKDYCFMILYEYL
ncbi:uncharacterized protein V6R79_000238 [Siganus canaliculatus]